jgi:hypothetical protein
MSSGTNVNRNTQHKWHNAAYLTHTGHRQYLPYAFGGGYILSLDLSKVRRMSVPLEACFLCGAIHCLNLLLQPCTGLCIAVKPTQ